MNLKELDSFRISDAISFHDELNPELWDGQHLRPEVKEQLLYIAKDFLEELGVNDLDVVDITVSGSNAAYSYTPHSDLDLHILVDLSKMDNNEIYKELFNAKKTIYNDTHDITIHGVPVELYVQDAREPVVSLGEYSILHDEWLRIPTKRRANLDQTATKQKYEKLHRVITKTLQSKNILQVDKVLKKIRQYRQAGLDKGGEFGPENLAFKILRKQGLIKKLYNLRDKLHSEKLTLDEENPLLNKPTPSIREVAAKHGVSFVDIMDQLVKGVNVELEHTNDEKVAREIALDHLSEDPEYYTKLASVNLEESWDMAPANFDYRLLQESIEEYFKKDKKYYPHRTHGVHQLVTNYKQISESVENEVKEFWNYMISLDQRSKVDLTPGQLVSVIQCWSHLYDSVFELRGNLNPKEIADVDYDSSGKVQFIQFVDGTTFPDKSFLDRGQGGALDGIVTTFYPSKQSAEQALTLLYLAVPDNWKLSKANLNESSLNEASGYIPSEKEKNDPRFKTALTVDVHPNTMKKDAKKFGNKISRAGIPPTLQASGKF